VTWTLSGGDAQTAYEVKIFSAAQYGAAGFDPATSAPTYFSGTVPNGSTTAPVFVGLVNGGTYRAYVRVASGTIFAYSWSSWVSSTFQILVFIEDVASPTPTNGSTVTTSRPTLGGNVATPMGGNIRMRRQWNFARDSGFTTETVVVTETTLSVLPVGAFPFPSLPSRLPSGTWFMRARTLDEFWSATTPNSNVGNWSATTSFAVAHQPSSGSWAPRSNNSVVWNGGTVTLSWVFGDPDGEDYQSAFEISVGIAGDVGSTAQSGVVTTPQQDSDNYSYAFTLPSTAYRDVQLAWKIRVRDQDGTWSGWSADQNFYARGEGTVTITSPGGTVSTPTPSVAWTYSGSGGRTQSQWRVTIFTSTGLTAASTGWISSAAGSWAITNGAIGIDSTYTAVVDVIDSAGIQATASQAFSASYVRPPSISFTVDSIDFANTGAMIVDWSGASPASNFVSWRIYRRVTGSSVWKFLKEITSGPVRSFTDFTCPGGVSVDYALVQTVYNDTFGVAVESDRISTSVNADCQNYLIVVPDNTSLNLKLEHVTAEEFDEEYEQETLNLIGRGRRSEVGSRWGFSGKITARLYDSTDSARSQHIRLQNIRRSGLKAYLRNPFGDVFAVGLIGINGNRIPGVGTRELLSVTIDYSEIEDD
jgi:hypothetical protein